MSCDETLWPFLKGKARELGFISVSVTSPQTPPFFERYVAWLNQGNLGDMLWLKRSKEVRKDPGRLLEGCKTVISLAFPYSARKPTTRDGFTISRYAEPDREDYHDRVRALCKPLVEVLQERHEGSRNKVCVDSSPLMERSLAYAAGIGFFGKNNMLIIPGYGSYFYLAEILTTVSLESGNHEVMESRCGDCDMCIASCPTGALVRPFTLDASRCLSYLTIEYKGGLDREVGKMMGDCFLGCDR
ncbi:MAG: tRNA epoxyqueuosine(34) reductase QueG, partial [Deltaproteobacteria bacterium]|nr:tRNA epoxyqueuosine(34) reductase QueG [Deltaproteobacteria bacterium]